MNTYTNQLRIVKLPNKNWGHSEPVPLEVITFLCVGIVTIVVADLFGSVQLTLALLFAGVILLVPVILLRSSPVIEYRARHLTIITGFTIMTVMQPLSIWLQNRQ